MNLIADNNIYPELIGGEVWFGRITDQIGEWYVKPRARYEMVEKFEGFIRDALPRADGTQPCSTKFGEITYNDGQQYEEFVDPIHITATKLWTDIQAYGNDVDQFVDQYDQTIQREVPHLF